jgi:hypothetical protein
MDEFIPKCMLLLRLTQSRSQTGSFYVKEVTDETIAAVSDALGFDDIQAFQIILFCSILQSYQQEYVQLLYCKCQHVHGIEVDEFATKPSYVYHSWAMNRYVCSLC